MPTDTACIVFTPGTESASADAPPRGKGVVLSHRSVLWTARRVAQSLGITGDDCYVSFLSSAQISEQLMALHVPILTGMPVFYVPEVRAARVVSGGACVVDVCRVVGRVVGRVIVS